MTEVQQSAVERMKQDMALMADLEPSEGLSFLSELVNQYYEQAQKETVPEQPIGFIFAAIHTAEKTSPETQPEDGDGYNVQGSFLVWGHDGAIDNLIGEVKAYERKQKQEDAADFMDQVFEKLGELAAKRKAKREAEAATQPKPENL